MNTTELKDYLVLSRGQWDPGAARETIEAAIAQFYDWYERNLATGRFKPGSRLGRDGLVVSRSRIVDGPFGETKEIIGGYWIITARGLRQAAELAAENPCLPYGLQFEIRPLEAERASVYHHTNETPE